MSTLPGTTVLQLGPEANGLVLTPAEFDTAVFEEGWRYELIHGVLVVSPAPLRKERDPNEELGHWLRSYQEHHSQGTALDATFYEETVQVGADRRRADRVIYAGQGRLPTADETPTIVVEFVSAGKRNLLRDYEEKREEYLAAGVQEYWVFDRFSRQMTVFTPSSARRVFQEDAVYCSPLLPGFEVRISGLLRYADRWA